MTYTPTDEQQRDAKSALTEHRIECTGPGEVTCSCREGGWMSWGAFADHQARAVLVAVGPSIAADAVRAAHTYAGTSGDPNPFVALLDFADQIEQEAR